jgi:tRNA threonylcarbamoyl adenosine modification protein YeaZ
MIVLALDTSTDRGSLALLRDDSVLATKTIEARMNHSAHLFPCVDQLLTSCKLKLSEVNLCAVGIGPGSFSGIRVSVAAAKAWRLALKIPIVGVSSADVIAEEALLRLPTPCRQIAVAMDARRDEWFVAFYQADAGALKKEPHPQLIAPASLLSLMQQATFVAGPDNHKLSEMILGLAREDKLAGENRLTAIEQDGCVVVGDRAFIEKKPSYPNAAEIGKLGLQKFRNQGGGDSQVDPIYLRSAVLVR